MKLSTKMDMSIITTGFFVPMCISILTLTSALAVDYSEEVPEPQKVYSPESQQAYAELGVFLLKHLK